MSNNIFKIITGVTIILLLLSIFVNILVIRDMTRIMNAGELYEKAKQYAENECLKTNTHTVCDSLILLRIGDLDTGNASRLIIFDFADTAKITDSSNVFEVEIYDYRDKSVDVSKVPKEEYSRFQR